VFNDVDVAVLVLLLLLLLLFVQHRVVAHQCEFDLSIFTENKEKLACLLAPAQKIVCLSTEGFPLSVIIHFLFLALLSPP